MWNFKTPGIPDENFERIDKVPITKEEVRTIQISKARLKPGHIIYDIGCGSGSISVEAALQIESSGKVFAIDFDENAIELTKKNAEKLNVMINKIYISDFEKENILNQHNTRVNDAQVFSNYHIRSGGILRTGRLSGILRKGFK